jgi:S1-C subfamily serine protease
LIYLGILGLEERLGEVVFKVAQTPITSRERVDLGGEVGPSVREVYTGDGPGVMTVDVGLKRIGSGGRSGFVVDEEGYVVTNQHLVEVIDSVSVRFARGARGTAEVVSEDPSSDIAVIKVDAPEEDLKPLTLSDLDAVGLGDPVIAIGNPLNVGISVTTGIVSGIGRSIPAPTNYTTDDVAQTDAAINPGNSGGPLLDARGVIGLTSQIALETGNFQGVGFAVPINTVENVVEQLIKMGKVEHGHIGVRMFPVGVEGLVVYSDRSAEELSREYGLPQRGAVVSRATEGGTAEEAGIRGGERVEEIAGLSVPLGDMVIQVEDDPVSTPDDLIKAVDSLKPSYGLNLTVVAPGERACEMTVIVGVHPNERSE